LEKYLVIRGKISAMAPWILLNTITNVSELNEKRAGQSRIMPQVLLLRTGPRFVC